MEELIKSIKTRNNFNNMDLNSFVVELEKFLDKKITDKEIEDFRYTGLSNSDLLKMYVSF